MPKFPIKDRNLIQGISQQATETRLPGQLEDCENCWPSPIQGLGKRMPTEHQAKVRDDWFRDAFVHSIDRDEIEQYQLVLSHKQAKIYDRAGTLIPIVSFAGSDNLVADPHDFFDKTYKLFAGNRNFAGKRNQIESADKTRMADLIEFLDIPGGNGDNDLTLEVAKADVAVGDQYLVTCEMKLGPVRDAAATLEDQASFRVQYVGHTPATDWHYIDFDLTNGTISLPLNNNITRSSIKSLDNGWYRCQFVWEVDSTAHAGCTSLEVELFPAGDLTSSTLGYGGVYLDNYVCVNLDATNTLDYLDIEEPNPITDGDTLASWVATNAPAVVVSSDTGPYGYSDWADVGVNASQATGTYNTNGAVDVFHEGWQILYCFTQEKSSDDTDSIRFGWLDTTNAEYHRALFTWSSGVLSATSSDGDVFESGVIDHGDGVYQPWIAMNTNDNVGSTVGGCARAVYLYINKAGASAGTTQVWGFRQVDGVSHPSKAPHIDPRKRLKAVTLADSTFVSNGLQTCSMSEYTVPSQNKDVRYLFIKKGEAPAEYMLSLSVGEDVWSVGLSTVADDVDATKFGGHAHWVLSFSNPLAGGLYSLDLTSTLTPTPGTYQVSFNLPADLGKYTHVNAARYLMEEIRKVWDPGNNNENQIVAYVDSTFHSRIHVRNVNPGHDLLIDAITTPGSDIIYNQQITDPHGGSLGLRISDLALASIAAALAQRIDDLDTNLKALSVNELIRVSTEDGQAIHNLSLVKSEGALDIREDLIGIIGDATKDITDLPLICEKGWTVRITGEAGSAVDDYYVKFEPNNIHIHDSDEDADIPTISEGRWVETIAPGSYTEIDRTTMPHQLVRKTDDSSGTFTGTAGRVYFEWNEVEWNDRIAGDVTTNPVPSFIGKEIRELFFHKGRLGFCSSDRVILSETNRYFNFYRTTVRSLVDSDPIDIGAGQNDVSFLNHVQMLGDNLFVFSDRDAFILEGTPTLTPATAALRPKVRHDSSSHIKPMPFGRSLMFFDSNSAFTRVRELFQSGGTDLDPQYDTADVGVAVPKLMEGEPFAAAACPLESCVAVVTDGDRSILYLYKYFQPGNERLQSSWTKWTFDGSKILGLNFIDSKLHITFEREVGTDSASVFLETMELGDGLTDTDTDFVVAVDSRLSDKHPGVSSVYAASATTFTLPHKLDGDATYQVVTRGSNAGRYYACTTNPESKTVTTVDDVDLTSTDVWIGIVYTASAKPTRPIKQQAALAGGLDFVTEGRLTIHRLTVVFSDTAEFTVEVTPTNGTLVTTTYNDGKNTGSGATLNDGELDLGVQSSAEPGFILELKNALPTPSNWLGIEYFVGHSPRYDSER